MTEKPKIIVIVGPTASGKSDLAVNIAKQFHGEIISADSRQVYRGLNLGTGKITKKEMQKIPHHLLDVADPKRRYSVARFQKDGRRAIMGILRRGSVPIIVGGTGFYIDALVRDMQLPDVKPDFTLRKALSVLSCETLAERLRVLDPKRAETIDVHNKVRLIRAIEIATQFGPTTPITTTSPYEICWIGLMTTKESLKKRIHDRLLKRMRSGMLAEVKQLHANGLSFRRMEELGLEYRYLARYLQNIIDKTQMLCELEKEITRYAKRQMTWFKRNSEIHWLEVGKTNKALLIVRNFLNEQ